MISRQLGGVNTPTVKPNGDFENKKVSPQDEKNKATFQKLIAESNELQKAQQQKLAGASEGGVLNVGESPTDREFRENLEKITGKKMDKMKNKLDKDDYLNLMVTQLKYQDPTKPMENTEMATQLAQFNTVEQLLGMNKLLEQIKNNQNQSQLERLSPLLGKDLKVKTDKILLKSIPAGDEKWMLGATLPQGAKSAAVEIKNDQGKVVRTLIPDGVKSTSASGETRVLWDGRDEMGRKVLPGAYNFSVEAASADGKPLDAQPFVTTKSTGIGGLDKGGHLETPLGFFELKDILSVHTA